MIHGIIRDIVYQTKKSPPRVDPETNISINDPLYLIGYTVVG